MEPEERLEARASFVDRQIGFMRFIAVLGVVSSSLLAIALFIAAIARTVIDILSSLAQFGTKDAVKQLLISGIDQADVLLVAVALLIVSFGLYTLFIGVSTNMPGWLKITSVAELKTKLTEVIVWRSWWTVSPRCSMRVRTCKTCYCGGG